MLLFHMQKVVVFLSSYVGALYRHKEKPIFTKLGFAL